jgi:hypothetical protein
MRGFGMGRMKGGWLRVVGMLGVDDGAWGRRPPICGIVAIRSIWSMCCASRAMVVVVWREVISRGRSISQ